MFKKILVALDGSSFSENALRVAVDEAKIRGAELHALYVVQHIVTHNMLYESGLSAPEGGLYHEIMEEEGKKVLSYAEEVALDDEVSIITHFVIGDPRDVIVDFSKEIKADLIIVGSSGKSGLDRFFLGSVSSSVIEHSGITTMVIRN